jgi:secondary thiamine-phosphate synthase enzyme
MDGHVLAEDTWPPLSLRRPEITSRLVSAAGRLRLKTTSPTGIVDLTSRVEAFVRATVLETGWVNVQSRHTTTGLLVNEHEPLLLGDLERLLERLAPRAASYAHDALHLRQDVPPDERPNGHAHAKASLLRSSETLNVAGRQLQLGRWQRILFVELDGPREREISLVALGHGAASPA